MMPHRFTLRRDQNGLRPVFLLGNELGECPLKCKFCNVRKPARVSSADNIKAFNELYTKYSKLINGPYHPLVYNRGNVTDPKEFSRKTFDYILNCFSNDERVRFVSINSRERFATRRVLDYLAGKNLNYPIHFIFGVESFSENAAKLLGKNAVGELERFEKKLAEYNQQYAFNTRKSYVFGLDVNLLFLPELYLREGESRNGKYSKIREGIKKDVAHVLHYAHSTVPIEINLHLFSQVETLPFEDAELDSLASVLPELQEIVERHNETSNYETHLFIGIEGEGYSSKYWENQLQKWKPSIDAFNETGRLF